MAINYPTSLDTFTNPAGTNTLDSPDHAGQHGDANDAIEALESKVGVGSGTPVVDQALVGSGNGTSVWTGTWNNATFGTPAITGGTINAVVVGTPAITGGTASAMTLGTPVVDQIDTSGTTQTTEFQKGISPKVVTLSDSAGGTVNVNAASGQIFNLQLGTTAGNRTLANPTSATEGQVITFRVQQNTGNTGTIVFASGYKMNNSGTPTLGTQSTWNYVGFRYYSGGTVWHHQGNSLGII